MGAAGELPRAGGSSEDRRCEKTFREEPSVGGTADLVLVLAHILNF